MSKEITQLKKQRNENFKINPRSNSINTDYLYYYFRNNSTILIMEKLTRKEQIVVAVALRISFDSNYTTKEDCGLIISSAEKLELPESFIKNLKNI